MVTLSMLGTSTSHTIGTRMANQQVGSQRASTQTSWWVITSSTEHQIVPGTSANVNLVQNATRPAGTIGGPFTSRAKAANWIMNQLGFGSGQGGGGLSNPLGNTGGIIGGWAGSWLKSVGADIGSGIESGFVTVLQDIWNVIVGPIEVLAGLALVLITFIAYFKDDIAAVAPMAMMAFA